MFPSPTAEPTVVAIAPRRVVKRARGLDDCIISKNYLDTGSLRGSRDLLVSDDVFFFLWALPELLSEDLSVLFLGCFFSVVVTVSTMVFSEGAVIAVGSGAFLPTPLLTARYIVIQAIIASITIAPRRSDDVNLFMFQSK